MGPINKSKGGLAWRSEKTDRYSMDSASRALLERTAQPRYFNGERKLSRDPFMQLTWGLLGVAALAQLILLLALDLVS